MILLFSKPNNLFIISAVIILIYIRFQLTWDPQAIDCTTTEKNSTEHHEEIIVKGNDNNDDDVDIVLERQCQSVLDDLDRTWDLRRTRRFALTRRISQVPNAEYTTYDYYEPEAVCLDDERFGGERLERFEAFGDGPKFVCGVNLIIASKQQKQQQQNNCLVYSVGSNNNIHFEKAVATTLGCEIHTFDPSLQPEEFVGGNFSTFHNWGFGYPGKNTTIQVPERGQFTFVEQSLEDVMKQLNHTNRTLDIFKIDCEGCEYDALKQAFKAIAAGRIKINQVQVEIHGYKFQRLKGLMRAADLANMRNFHKERNHWGCMGRGCIEYAFVSAEFLRTVNGYYICHRGKI